MPNDADAQRSTERNDSVQPVSIIGRVSAILACFTHQDPVISVSEVARRTGLAKATTWRLTNELIEHGFLEHSGKDLTLGLRFFELGEKASRPRSLRRLTYAHMEGLRRRTGHTVHLAVLDGRQVVYVEILPSRTSPRLPSRVGGRMPAHATGVGKALLAYSAPDVIDRLIERGLAEVGPRTIIDGDTLRDELARVRRAGVAIEREESGPGIACVAAPILVDREPIAAISVSGWVGDIDLHACAALIAVASRELHDQASALPPGRRTL